ncbi:MAG: Rne/Rng family ribonuclease [Planctomycetota bacterium]
MEMYINACDADEIRVAVVHAGVLEHYFVERASKSRTRKGDIFVGKVANVDQGLQAAFVDIGEGPHGFLTKSDVKYPDGGFSELLRGKLNDAKLTGDVDLAKILRRGQKIVVQVIRETIGHKGPSLTTYAGIPGRFLVMVPETPEKAGISRKIESEEERRRLKELRAAVQLPPENGYIFRTASLGCTLEDIANDIIHLDAMWSDIARQIKLKSAPTPRNVYREDDLLVRIFRDVYNEKITKVFIDSQPAYDKIVAFLKTTMPNKVRSLQLAETREPIFEKYQVEQLIENIVAREVALSNGGAVVIEQTEAMVAIDVNSGSYHDTNGQEQAALQTNLLAAEEIARQLRLRNTGGIINIDFIDMKDHANRRTIENTLAEALKVDKARINMLQINEFGVLQLTRQRDRQNVISVHFAACPACKGRGFIKSKQTNALEVLRGLRTALARCESGRGGDGCVCEVTAHPELAENLQNEFRRKLVEFEAEHQVIVTVHGSGAMAVGEVRYKVHKNRHSGSSNKGNEACTQ